MIDYDARIRAQATGSYLVTTGLPLALVAAWIIETGAVGWTGALALLVLGFGGGLALNLFEWAGVLAGPPGSQRPVPRPATTPTASAVARLDARGTTS